MDNIREPLTILAIEPQKSGAKASVSNGRSFQIKKNLMFLVAEGKLAPGVIVYRVNHGHGFHYDIPSVGWLGSFGEL